MGPEMGMRGHDLRQELLRGRNRCLKLKKWDFCYQTEAVRAKRLLIIQVSIRFLTFIPSPARHVNLEDFWNRSISRTANIDTDPK